MNTANYNQFQTFKEKYPDAVILFRDGMDAYYSYDNDADVLNKVLSCPILDWDGIKAAGFPHEALDVYLPRLIRAGYRVAICDELEDPKKQAKRGITETVTRKEPVQLSLFDF